MSEKLFDFKKWIGKVMLVFAHNETHNLYMICMVLVVN